jgi:hypothetical protein
VVGFCVVGGVHGAEGEFSVCGFFLGLPRFLSERGRVMGPGACFNNLGTLPSCFCLMWVKRAA